MGSQEKPTNILSTDHFYMAVALLAERHSKDPNTKVGACLVNEEGKIISIGFRRMPTEGETFPWVESERILESKETYVLHAEMDALVNMDSKNCTLFVSVFPCNECAKLIIKAGVKEVIYLFNEHAQKEEIIASKIILEAAGIKLRIPELAANIDLSTDHFYMAVALLAERHSKDPYIQSGACLVNPEGKIISIGYNRMPKNGDHFPWGRSDNELESKYTYVCHAELDVLVNMNAEKCTLYVTVFPCNECAKIIIQSSVKNIVYFVDLTPETIETQASKRMLGAAKIEYKQFSSRISKIDLEFIKEYY